MRLLCCGYADRAQYRRARGLDRTSPDGRRSVVTAETRIGPEAGARPTPPGSALEVLGVATRLGLTSFGGPVAHLGYFHDEYVVRRRWLDEQTYADLVALCQFLPGPASSQVGIGVGLLRAGLWGGIAAWIGFTLPSALALVAFAAGVQYFGVADAGWLRGLNIV